MSDRDRGLRRRALSALARVDSFVFGDDLGAALFAGTLLFLLFGWQADFVINDNVAVANAFAAMTEGHLHVDRIAYRSLDAPSGTGGGLAVPGMHVVGDRLYAENYGQLFLALPVYLAIAGVAAVADLPVAIAGAWSLLALVVARRLGTALGRRRRATLVGSGVALALFAANLAVAVDVSDYWHRYMAVQLSTMLAAALAVVVLYRLVERIHGQRAGAFAGAFAALGTPLGYWGSVPMRHATTTLLALLSVYLFYGSRRAEGRRAVRLRALSYAPVGLLAWVFAPEGLMLLLALLAVDLPTSLRPGRLRETGVVAGVLALSLLPFFAMNVLVSGNPLEPTVLLDQYTGAENVTVAGVDPPSGSAGGAPPGGEGGNASARGGSAFGGGGGTLPAILGPAGLFLNVLANSLAVVLFEPDRLYHTFIRSGQITYGPIDSSKDLTLLESMPLAAAALAALPAAGRRALRDRSAVREWATSPEGRTDLLVGAFAGILTLLYIQALPRQVQFTVRYLLPAMVLLVYVAVRVPAVREAIEEAPSTVVWAYLLGVLLGGQLVVARVVSSGIVVAEAMQLHAWVGLSAAALVAVWAFAATWGGVRRPRVGAATLGLAAAATTVLVVAMTTSYFVTDTELILPVARVFGGAIGIG